MFVIPGNVCPRSHRTVALIFEVASNQLQGNRYRGRGNAAAPAMFAHERLTDSMPN